MLLPKNDFVSLYITIMKTLIVFSVLLPCYLIYSENCSFRREVLLGNHSSFVLGSPNKGVGVGTLIYVWYTTVHPV